jgi:hypothetical protein
MAVALSGTTKRGYAMTRHDHYTLGGENPPKSTYYGQGKFGRMFPMLPPFATDTPSVRNALEELGKKGGIMDVADETDIVANPNLARDLITNPALNVNNGTDYRLTSRTLREAPLHHPRVIRPLRGNMALVPSISERANKRRSEHAERRRARGGLRRGTPYPNGDRQRRGPASVELAVHHLEHHGRARTHR